MGTQLTTADLHLMNGEPSVLDLRLAEALDFERTRDIRKLVDRNMIELQSHGEVCATVAQTSPEGGRPATEYHLNEAQAVLICMFSRTDKAAEVRTEIIRVFLAYRRGELTRAFVDPQGDSAERWKGAPNQEQLRLLTECRLIFGAARARILWRQLDLPMLPDGVTTPDDDARACLRFLLDQRSKGGDDTIGDLIEAAIDGEERERLCLMADGIRVASEGPQRGFFVPANHAGMLALFAGSPWAGKGYVRALRRLPGAVAGEVKKFGHHTHRTVFLPLDVLDSDGPVLN